MQITLTELKDMLSDSKGCTAVTITTLTPVTRIKAKNPWKKDLVKCSRVNGMIGWKYENSVNNRRVKEEKVVDFKALPRTWGDRIPGTPLVEYKNRFYLELKVERVVQDPRYVDSKSGKWVNKNEITPYLYKSSNKSRQDLDQNVILRDYKLENILEISFRGEKYEISDTPHDIVKMFTDFENVNNLVLAFFADE